MKEKCAKCGRNKLNPSKLCYECNKKWQKYMKANPLDKYNPPSKIESYKRWNDFINEKEKVIFT